MKTIIIYYSRHHGNTKKLIDAIMEKNELDAVEVTEAADVDLSQYDRIGLASGVYFGSFAKQITEFAKAMLPEGKDVFLMLTCGANPSDSFYKSITEVVEEKGCKVIGRYGCYGYDTFGPFKLVGGIKKGHPTEEEIQGAVQFYEEL